MSEEQPKKKMSGCMIAAIVLAVIAALTIGGCMLTGGLFVAGVSQAVQEAEEETQRQLDELANATEVSDLRPSGHLAELFNLMSENTDIQRDNARAEIQGKMVQWTLPVYEVSKTGDTYRVQTSSQNNLVGTFIDLHPISEGDNQLIEALKTGDMVTVQGFVDGTMMRNIQISPAILIVE